MEMRPAKIFLGITIFVCAPALAVNLPKTRATPIHIPAAPIAKSPKAGIVKSESSKTTAVASVPAAGGSAPIPAPVTPEPGKPVLGCSGKKQESSIVLESARFWRLTGGQPVNVYLANLKKCYYRGQVVDLVEIKPPQKITYWSNFRGKATITNISEIKLGDIRKIELSKMSDREILRIGNRVKKANKMSDKELMSQPVLIVTISSSLIEDHLQTYGVPAIHPVAKTLSEKEFDSQLSAGHVYDVRPESLRKEEPLKNSKPLQISNPEVLALKIYSPSAMRKKGMNITSAHMPKIRDSITVISECPGEFSAYNSLTLLSRRGYKNLSWYPAGYEAYQKDKTHCLTPATSSVAKVLDGRGVATMRLQGGTTVLDLRIGPAFTIAGAVSLPFTQKVDELSMPLLRDNITISTLQKFEENFDAALLKKYPTNQTFILFGDSSFDWRPYKAAIILNSLGYKNIYWYRDGMADWAQKVLTYPKYYLLNKKVTNKDLY